MRENISISEIRCTYRVPLRSGPRRSEAAGPPEPRHRLPDEEGSDGAIREKWAMERLPGVEKEQEQLESWGVLIIRLYKVERGPGATLQDEFSRRRLALQKPTLRSLNIADNKLIFLCRIILASGWHKG